MAQKTIGFERCRQFVALIAYHYHTMMFCDIWYRYIWYNMIYGESKPLLLKHFDIDMEKSVLAQPRT